MRNTGDGMTIGEFAHAAGVGVETIRFYQRQGLIATPRRAYGKVRRYGPADVSRVRFVKSAQHLGFSLYEVADLLRLDDGAHCGEARVLAEHKLQLVRAKLDDLRLMETALARLVRRCRTRAGMVACPLIEALHDG
jgi:MerR family mercuric resistance operon transcriptional regulator